MRQSYLFTRVFGVVILTIVMTALFTTFIYNYIATSIFTRIKENELLPRARALGAVLGLILAWAGGRRSASAPAAAEADAG